MAPSSKALVLALISAVASPILIVVELLVVVLVAMGTQDPDKPLQMHIAAVVTVLLFACLVFALPVIALIMGTRARKAVRSGGPQVDSASKALTSVVIAGAVIVVVALAQVYLVLMAAGLCGLDGCY
jgi:heme/copper-type cytochrome/quinol oxidase subunit 2